jgi:transposase, IS6 family
MGRRLRATRAVPRAPAARSSTCSSPRRDVRAARRFFEQAIGTTEAAPSEVVSDQAPTYPMVLDELLPAVWHRTDRYANNHIEADHGRLKSGCGR